MQRTDRWAGLALALLGLAVMWSARSFPNVPGQKLGAGFLPMLVGAGLLLCAVALIVRSLRAAAYARQGADEDSQSRTAIADRLGQQRLETLARGYLSDLRRAAVIDIRM